MIDYVLFNHHIYDEKIFKKYIIQIKNYNGSMDECSIVTYKRWDGGLGRNVFFLLLQVIHDHSHQAAAPQRLLLPWLSLTRNILFS